MPAVSHSHHAPSSGGQSPSPRVIAPIFVGVLVFMVAFIWLYVAAFHDPKPNGVEVAVVGPAGLEQQLQERVDQAGVGDLDFVAYPDEDAARAAVQDQDVQGALIAGRPASQLLVAGGGSFMIAQAIEHVMRRATEAAGVQLAVEDVRPLPRGDSRGLSLVFLAFGLGLPSVVLGIALWALAGGVGGRRLVVALSGFALAAGLCAAFTVEVLVGAVDGAFWELTLIGALLVLAVSAATAGMGRLLGPVAVPLALLLFVLLSMSGSGGPVGNLMLPDFFKAIGDLLPVGAALEALRDTVYFAGEQSAVPLVVLGCWALGGVVLLLVGRNRGVAGRAAATPSATTPAPVAA